MKIVKVVPIAPTRHGKRRWSMNIQVETEIGSIIINGFLYSEGGQLIGPQSYNKGRYFKQIGIQKQAWQKVRDVCKDYIAIQDSISPVDTTDSNEAMENIHSDV